MESFQQREETVVNLFKNWQIVFEGPCMSFQGLRLKAHVTERISILNGEDDHLGDC